MKSPKDEPTPFHSFIGEWRSKHLKGVTKGEIARMADTLATELKEAALHAGFRTHLTNACRPYRSMSAYVIGLHDVQASEHRR